MGFTVEGHTGASGRSVVCAAVSSACYMAANTITEIIGARADVSVADGYMRVMTAGEDVVRSQDILRGLRLHAENMAQQYPHQIRITYTEVQ